MQAIVISSLTGAEIASNFTLYLVYGYPTSLVFTAIGLFGYIGIHSGELAYLRTYVLLSMIVSFVRMIEFITATQINYILPLVNFYSMLVCLYVARYIKSVSQVVIGSPVHDEAMNTQNDNQGGTEYKVASFV